MIYEYTCPSGHRTEEILPVALRDTSSPCHCGARRTRLVSKPSAFIMPQHMSDENISSNARHREWLKTPEARAMNLEPTGEDPEGPDDQAAQIGTDPMGIFDVLDEVANTRNPHHVETAAAMLDTTPEDVVERVSAAERTTTMAGALTALRGSDTDTDPVASRLDAAMEATSAIAS